MANAGWFIDGIDGPQGDPLSCTYEQLAIQRLKDITVEYPDLSTGIAGLEWAFDEDMTCSEDNTIWAVTEIEALLEGAGVWVLGLPWIGDDLTAVEKNAVHQIWDMAQLAVDWDRDFFSLMDLVADIEQDQVRFLDLHTMGPLSSLHAQGLQQDLPSEWRIKAKVLLQDVLSAPWFNDGLDDEERVRIISFWYDDLMGPYFVQSKVINLPLAGEVKLWIAQHEPIPGCGDVLGLAEEAVRGTERLTGVPFPISDVIVAIVRHQDDQGSVRYVGTAYNDRVEVGDWLSGNRFREVLYHEIAHHYFTSPIGPTWLIEGGAEYAEARIEDWLGYTSLKEARIASEDAAQMNCVEHGFVNLNALATYEYAKETARRHRGCNYDLGLDFLLDLQEIMGDEAMSNALGALYLTRDQRSASGKDWTKSDLDIYSIILESTPPDRVEEVKALFRQKHGGSFIDPED